MENFAKVIGTVILGFAAIFVLALIGTIPVYFLWNWLMPPIFGIKVITFFQAWGILALFGVLFKSNSTSST